MAWGDDTRSAWAGLKGARWESGDLFMYSLLCVHHISHIEGGLVRHAGAMVFFSMTGYADAHM